MSLENIKGKDIDNFSSSLEESKIPDNPHTPCIMKNQATINIGTIGHVAHGKSTIVKAITSTKTIRFRLEAIKNSTIKLGYANAKIFHCANCPSPQAYQSFPSSAQDPLCLHCNSSMELKRHISFVDCPGHDILMATMLNGAAVMDAALLLIASNESCPQPQTLEHLAAVQISGLEKILVLQNKIDLIKKKDAALQKEQILNFVKGTNAEKSPILPISAQLKLNVDVINEYLCKFIDEPKRDLEAEPEMIIIRRFDVNKPGRNVQEIKGGVAGGSLLKGVLKVGDKIEIRPGIVTLRRSDSVPVAKPTTGNSNTHVSSSPSHSMGSGNESLSHNTNNANTNANINEKVSNSLAFGSAKSPKKREVKYKCKKIYSTIKSLMAESNKLQFALPGGLIAVGTDIDPVLLRSDRLVGQVLGLKGKLPPVFTVLELKFYLLNRLVGSRTDEEDGKKNKVTKIKNGESLMFNVGSMCTGGKVLEENGVEKKCRIELMSPVCTRLGEKVAISRRVEQHWRLIGWGRVLRGEEYVYDD